MTPEEHKTPSVLIVDDDRMIRIVAREALESAGWTVEEAVNGRDAVTAFQRIHPDIVLLDVMMPELDGFAACKAIRQLPDGAHTPVLIMTGLTDYDSIAQAYEAGATDFVTKPLHGLLLTHRIRYIVQSNRISQELRTSQASLAQARDAALEGTRLKSEFLATVSHELRTPMNGILGMTDLLRDTSLTSEQRDYADTIRASGEILLSTINDILDFSKIESGHFPLHHVDFDLSRLLDDVVGVFAERAQRNGITLLSSVHAQVPTALRGDRHRLHQVLSNLLGNAVKFTEQGEITVGVNMEERRNGRDPLRDGTPVAPMPGSKHADRIVLLHFSVADTGIGIAREAHARIFQPFGQADGSNTRKYGGAGLGLAICKQLLELMGGVIGVESEPGRGSVFHFTVPLEHSSADSSLRPRGTAAA